MKQRIIYGSIYVIVLLGMTLAHELSFQLLYLGFMFIGLYELLKASNSTKLYLPLTLLLVFPILGVLRVLPAEYSHEILAAVALIFFLYPHILALTLFQKHPMQLYGIYFTFIGYVAVPFLLTLDLGFQHSDTLVSLFVLIWINDSFAYLTGRFFGKNKLFPSVSPNKTVEGLIGGVVFCLLAGWGLSLWGPKANWLWIAPIVAISSNVGDLVQSNIKRHTGIKDMGNIIPGHGGILDRLDSFIFSIPIVYYILKFL